MPEGTDAARQYDAMAAAYSLENETNIFNALFERPTTLSLLGDVSGLAVLEVGCGAGLVAHRLSTEGATVVAMDASSEMLELARRRVGGSVRLVHGRLEDGLAFQASCSVDLVVASLVLHYIRDWEAVFGEFRRVLRPGGALVFSTHHPAMDWRIHSPDDYFAVKWVTETWALGGAHVEVSFWRRPLGAMTAAVHSAGFLIEQIVEPVPSAEVERLDPEVARSLRTEPSFIFFRLRAA